jgi:DNA-binding transcriptional ArsR family regulator
MSQSRISNHLRLLKEGDALDARREGTWTFYRNALSAHGDSADLWGVVRGGLTDGRDFRADLARRKAVLEKRRRRSREYFSRRGAAHASDAANGTGTGTGLEHDSIREELIASLLPPEWTVLDVGCGDGYLTEALSARFAKVIAIDHSPERIATAQGSKAPASNSARPRPTTCRSRPAPWTRCSTAWCCTTCRASPVSSARPPAS